MHVLVKHSNALGLCSLQETHTLSFSGNQDATPVPVLPGVLGLQEVIPHDKNALQYALFQKMKAHVWNLSRSLLFACGIAKSSSSENGWELYSGPT